MNAIAPAEVDHARRGRSAVLCGSDGRTLASARQGLWQTARLPYEVCGPVSGVRAPISGAFLAPFVGGTSDAEGRFPTGGELILFEAVGRARA
jgi:hypothetical protein